MPPKDFHGGLNKFPSSDASELAAAFKTIGPHFEMTLTSALTKLRGVPDGLVDREDEAERGRPPDPVVTESPSPVKGWNGRRGSLSSSA